MKSTYFKLQVLFIALCLILMISNKGYSTNVSGGIFANTTWTRANSPYIITDTVVIFAGVTVFIEPGVVVKFDSLAEIDQRGNLYAQGVASDSIIFTSNSAKPFAGIYEGIYISSQLNTPADSFIYCRFSYAKAAINITTGIGSSFPISHCSFFSNRTGINQFTIAKLIDNCVFKYDSTGINQTGMPYGSLITGCTFRNNGTGISFGGDSIMNCTFYNNNTGITGIAGQGLIKNCILDSNKVCGIGIVGGIITNCTIRYNAIGIISEEEQIISNDISYNNIGIVSNTDKTISCNSICNNTNYNIELNANTNESVSGNYWCLTDSTSIRATIYDGHQNISLGLIYFSPFLTTPCINTSCRLVSNFNYTANKDSLVTFNDLTTDSSIGATITAYSWNFGDPGNSNDYSSLKNPTHLFTSSGTYTVCLSVTNSLGCSSSICKQVTVPQSKNCHLTAKFNYFIDVSNIIYFSDLSTDSNSVINSWHWDLGALGGTSSIQNPGYNFSADTAYNVDVCLTVTDSAGCSNTACQQILINTSVNCFLTSNFSYSADTTGLATFQDLSTDSTAGAALTSWTWDFGDGTGSTLENPTHIFTVGFHTVCLTVTNTMGCSKQFCKQIQVNTHGITCQLNALFSYTINDTTGTGTFTDLSPDSTKGATINSWNWTFGNFQNPSTEENPTHVFIDDTANSVFYVCLTVKNSLGCSSQSCQQVLVNKIEPPCLLNPQFSYSSDSTGLATFNDLTTDSTFGASITGWSWDFGDAASPVNYSYSQNPIHSFTSAGTYKVCLTVHNSQGCSDFICQQVTINVALSTLCVTVTPLDSTIGNQPQNTEFYLIKNFNTASGDSLALIDTFVVDSQFNAYHCFTGLANGTYYVKAEYTPTSSQYSSFLPTYYNTALLWNNSTPLNLNGSQFITLLLLKGTNPGGPGFIGGYVSQGANRLEQGTSTNAFGDPEPGETVILTTFAGDAVAHTLTDAKGYYQFSNLAFGTYYIAVDELNKPCDLPEVTIDDSTGYRENADFQVNSKSVTSQIVLSTYTVTQHPLTASLLGNPVGDELELFTKNMNKDAVITITDLLGREALIASAAGQTTLIKLNVHSLASGVYLVTLNSGSDVKTIKFVKE